MEDKTQIQAEVDANYEAFKELLPKLLEQHDGKFALMRNRKLVDMFESVNDAVVFAKGNYDDDLFSVQEISNRNINLGYFSHASNNV